MPNGSIVNNLNNHHDHPTKRTITTAEDDNKKEINSKDACDLNDATKQIDGTTKKASDSIDSNDTIDSNDDNPITAYCNYKKEAEKLKEQIEIINKKLDNTQEDSSNKDKTNEGIGLELEKKIEKLHSIIKNMEYHKKRIHYRKTDNYSHNKVLNTISHAIPNYETFCPKTMNLRARFISFCSDTKKACINAFTTIQGMKKLVKNIIRTILLVAIIVIPYLAVALCIANPFLILPILAAMLIIVGTLSVICFIITKCSESRDASEPSNTPILQQLKTMAECLITTDRFPDIKAITQLIIDMTDHSYLSGDDDYDNIYNNLITYLQEHRNIIHSMISRSRKMNDDLFYERVMDLSKYHPYTMSEESKENDESLKAYKLVPENNHNAKRGIAAAFKEAESQVAVLPGYYNTTTPLSQNSGVRLLTFALGAGTPIR